MTDNTYQFSHVSAYYTFKKRNAYAYGDTKSGDAYDSMAMYMYRLSAS